MILFVSVILSFLVATVRGVEPLTVGAGVMAAVGVGTYYLSPKCVLCECCSEAETYFSHRWINTDDTSLARLKRDLEEKLYGQPFASTIIYKAISRHVKDNNPVKPLVLSFHGWTGSGKNYAASFIAKNLYRNGLDSKFVHLIIGTDRFIDSSKVDVYKVSRSSVRKHALSIYFPPFRMKLICSWKNN